MSITDEQIDAGARALAEMQGESWEHLPEGPEADDGPTRHGLREEASAVLTAAAEATQAETPEQRLLMTHPSDGHGPDDACLDCEKAETPEPPAEPVAYALYDRSKKGRVLFVSKHEVRESDYAYWRVVPLYAKGEGSE